jgi:hypothetical protein
MRLTEKFFVQCFLKTKKNLMESRKYWLLETKILMQKVEQLKRERENPDIRRRTANKQLCFNIF